MELTVPWEENFADAEHRKEERYEKLIDECKEQGWKVEYYHLAVGARGFIEKKMDKSVQTSILFLESRIEDIFEQST